MIGLLNMYADEAFIDVLVTVLSFFPAGVLLAVFGWVISYFVYAVLRFIRSAF